MHFQTTSYMCVLHVSMYIMHLVCVCDPSSIRYSRQVIGNVPYFCNAKKCETSISVGFTSGERRENADGSRNSEGIGLTGTDNFINQGLGLLRSKNGNFHHSMPRGADPSSTWMAV